MPYYSKSITDSRVKEYQDHMGFMSRARLFLRDFNVLLDRVTNMYVLVNKDCKAEQQLETG